VHQVQWKLNSSFKREYVLISFCDLLKVLGLMQMSNGKNAYLASQARGIRNGTSLRNLTVAFCVSLE
jgi:hypothetical protein